MPSQNFNISLEPRAARAARAVGKGRSPVHPAEDGSHGSHREGRLPALPALPALALALAQASHVSRASAGNARLTLRALRRCAPPSWGWGSPSRRVWHRQATRRPLPAQRVASSLSQALRAAEAAVRCCVGANCGRREVPCKVPQKLGGPGIIGRVSEAPLFL